MGTNGFDLHSSDWSVKGKKGGSKEKGQQEPE
jgi:hypothetical protein